MTRLLSVYTKQSTMLKKKLHGEAVLGHPSKLVVTSLKKEFKTTQKRNRYHRRKAFVVGK